MKKLRNTEAELKRASLIKKTCILWLRNVTRKMVTLTGNLNFLLILSHILVGKINKAVFISAKRLRK